MNIIFPKDKLLISVLMMMVENAVQHISPICIQLGSDLVTVTMKDIAYA